MSADQETKERDHTRPDGGKDPDALWDANVAIPSHAERARTLVAREKTGTLCTLSRDPVGYPYGSVANFALCEGHPVFLISALAEHTKNLIADPRASFLIAEAGPDNPLALGRLTLLGDAAQLEGDLRAQAREAVLAAHPNAAGYADYRDFSFWRLSVQSVRYIGGFGRMSWIDKTAWLDAAPDPIAPIAQEIIDHMNKDHDDVLIEACRAFTPAKTATEVQMVGVDRYGFEISVAMPSGQRPARIAFAEPIANADQARKAMVRIAKDARAQLAIKQSG